MYGLDIFQIYFKLFFVIRFLKDFIFVFKFSSLYEKRGFVVGISSVNVTKSALNCGFGKETADLVTFIEAILSGKVHIFCAVSFNT